MSRFLPAVFCAAMVAAVSAPLSAQISVPPNQVTNFKDPSILKAPAGAKIAILEWEDLECPACAHAYPIVHKAILDYHIPLVERDFPLQMHIWSKQAALYSRYLNDKVSPDVANEYRKTVFASQYRISSKEDLEHFTQSFFASHGKQIPFVVDPGGQLQKEIDADYNLGMKLGVAETPTIVVVTQHHWIQVKDVMQLYNAIDQAKVIAEKEGGPAPAPTVKKPAAVKK